MANEFYLIYGEDNFYYIISKKGLIVTDDSDLKLDKNVQFLYPENSVRPKIRKGKIIEESGK